MAIVVEDGTIVAGATSYVTEAELSSYAVARGITLPGTGLDTLLIKSMDYVESLSFKGIKSTDAQPLQWPRWNVVVDDYLISGDVIPQLLKEGQMEVALSIQAGNDPLSDISRLKTSATVGPISVTYAPGQATTVVRKINAKLQKLMIDGGTGISFVVDRG